MKILQPDTPPHQPASALEELSRRAASVSSSLPNKCRCRAAPCLPCRGVRIHFPAGIEWGDDFSIPRLVSQQPLADLSSTQSNQQHEGVEHTEAPSLNPSVARSKSTDSTLHRTIHISVHNQIQSTFLCKIGVLVSLAMHILSSNLAWFDATLVTSLSNFIFLVQSSCEKGEHFSSLHLYVHCATHT